MGVGTSTSGIDANGHFGMSNDSNKSRCSESSRGLSSKAEEAGSSGDEEEQKLAPNESKKSGSGDGETSSSDEEEDGEESKDFSAASLKKFSTRTTQLIANAPITKTALDEETLQVLKTYLSSGDFANDNLEDDEVAIVSIATSRYANERTRYRQNLLEEAEIGDGETFYDRVYKEEEFYALANEFFKNVVMESQAVAGGTQMHSKTVNWVKRAAGLQRPYEKEQQPYLSDSGEGKAEATDGAPRRLTRGSARTARDKRREERARQETEGVRAILEAIEELEKERGDSLPKSKRLAGVSLEEHPSLEDEGSKNDDQSIDTIEASGYRKVPIPPHPERALIARFRGRPRARPKDMRVVRVLVQGRHVSGATEEEIFEWRRERKRIRNREYYLERKKARSQARLGEDTSATHRHETRETATGYPPKRRSATEFRGFLEGDCEGSRRQGEILCPGDSRSWQTSHQPNVLFPSSGEEGWSDPIASGLIEWRRRVQEGEEGKASRQAKKSSLEPRSLRPALAEACLEYSHLPQEEERDSPTVSSPSAVHDDPPRTFSDQCYASSCKRLIHFLGGRARDWAKHEFFYCDIDRAWYNFDEFAADVARFVPPTMKLTRREWSIVRRQIRRRPRRFSKRFIASQLKKRNRYRSIVRRLQQNPDCAQAKGFVFPELIHAGTTVTAYSKRCNILHRGTVLFYSPRDHGYFIQFERKGMGCEFCPDTDVASHGIPDLLLHAAESPFIDETQRAMRNQLSNMGTLRFGTMHYLTPDVQQKDGGQVTTMNTLAKNRSSQTSDPSTPDRRTIAGQCSERDILVALVATIERAIRRKMLILDAIETSSALLDGRCSSRGHSGDNERGRQFQVIKEHGAWLLANLRLANQTLDVALNHMQVMYGRTYSHLSGGQLTKHSGIDLEARPWLSGQLDDLFIAQSDKSGGSTPERQTNLSHCATSLLLPLTYYCEAIHADSKGTLSPEIIESVLGVGLNEYERKFESSPPPECLHSAMLKEAAYSDLKEAVELFRAEIASHLAA